MLCGQHGSHHTASAYLSFAGLIRTLKRERTSSRSNQNHRAGRLLPFSGPVNPLLLRHQIAAYFVSILRAGERKKHVRLCAPISTIWVW